VLVLVTLVAFDYDDCFRFVLFQHKRIKNHCFRLD